MSFLQRHRGQGSATLDMDATLVQSHKRQAEYCYKKFKACQPLNTWWAEQQVIVHSGFRDANVPAGYRQLQVLQASLAALPGGVDKVCLRSDTAGYQKDLLLCCGAGRDKVFGVIEFAASANVTAEFRRAALPSGLFGANAAWWAIMVLAHDLNAVMKQLVLGPAWVARRMKALRLALIALPGRVIRHARRLIIRLASEAGLDPVLGARRKILALARGPT